MGTVPRRTVLAPLAPLALVTLVAVFAAPSTASAPHAFTTFAAPYGGQRTFHESFAQHGCGNAGFAYGGFDRPNGTLALLARATSYQCANGSVGWARLGAAEQFVSPRLPLGAGARELFLNGSYSASFRLNTSYLNTATVRFSLLAWIENSAGTNFSMTLPWSYSYRSAGISSGFLHRWGAENFSFVIQGTLTAPYDYRVHLEAVASLYVATNPNTHWTGQFATAEFNLRTHGNGLDLASVAYD